MWTAKTVKRPTQQPAQPQDANYWAPLTRKRHTMPHPSQPRHTSHWALRTRKRHRQEPRPQRPTEHSDPTQHAKGRTGDCPGPRKEATTSNSNATQCHTGGGTSPPSNASRGVGHDAQVGFAPPIPFHWQSARLQTRIPMTRRRTPSFRRSARPTRFGSAKSRSVWPLGQCLQHGPHSTAASPVLGPGLTISPGGSDVLERPYTVGGGGVPPPGPPSPPLLPCHEADSPNFASAPSVSRGFKLKKILARLRRGP